MFKIKNLLSKFTKIAKPAGLIYPIIIIVTIPVLLIVNTVWNLKNFKRDVNFLIRHQAASISETLKPAVSQNLGDTQTLYTLLKGAVDSNVDLQSATIVVQKGTNLNLLTSTDPNITSQDPVLSELANLTVSMGFDESYAGLNYDIHLQENVWDVTVPIVKDNDSYYILATKITVQAVDELLSRTSKDSITILVILVAATIALLLNHFIFYRKAMETKKLEELDKLKDEFISMASHELQAPVTGLVGYLELLQDKITPIKNTGLQSDVDTLKTLTNDLHNLIQDLLNVSRIEQGRIKVEMKDVQVNEIIDNVIKTFGPQAKGKNLELLVEKGELPVIQTDPDRLRQVIANLVSNSIKYTLEGQVKVSSAVEKDSIKVAVSDTGIGIPPDHLSKMFTKFHRVQDEKTKEVRGTGLGLWIIKQIVELLGGQIYIESIYGTGTTLSFTLPVRGNTR
ncbi:HAMP domain-containing histidine kinase [Candidatus Woesebacteria bacterium]|nr:HAMP domain-containing histidine kinase [Candidatus Woesebacteria bacterium]